jgi:methyl-accepting chemotaxis protein
MDFIPGLDMLSLLGAGAAGALSIWNFIQSPSKRNEGSIDDLRKELKTFRDETASKIEAVDDKTDEVAGRVSKIETLMQSLPDKEGLHRLEISLTQISGQLETLSARIGPIDNLSRRLQEVLLERANER